MSTIKPEDVFNRTVYRTYHSMPYHRRHRHVGDANAMVSELSNTERMFAYYPDHQRRSRSLSSEKSRAPTENECSQSMDGDNFKTKSKARSNARSGVGYHSDGEDRPAVRWTLSQSMALWGSVHQPSSSPLSHTTGRGRRRSPTHQRSSSSVAGAATHSSSGRKLNLSCGSAELHDSDGEEMREGGAARSFGVNDYENLSDTVKRALKALNMLPYKGPSGKSWLYVNKSGMGYGVETTPEAHETASQAQSCDRSTLVRKTAIAAEASLVTSVQKKERVKKDKWVKELHILEKRKRDIKFQKPDELYGEFVRIRDCMDCGNGVGGVKVGFGGLGLLAEHVKKGLVNNASPLCIEIEFCTHGYDGVSRGNKENSKYYTHYMHVCDVIEESLYPTWNVAFIIKKGKPRQGAFEVELLWVVGSVEYSVTLASKLCSAKFPSARKICRRLEVALEVSDTLIPE